jgi:hypothetical protein
MGHKGLGKLHWLLGLMLVSILQVSASPEPYFLPTYNDGELAALIVACSLSLMWSVNVLVRHLDPDARVPFWFILWPCATFAIARIHIGAAVPPAGSVVGALLSGLFVAASLLAAVKGRHLAWVAFASLILGVFWRIHYFAIFPIDPARADMLPLVTAALEQLFSGHSPYRVYSMPWPLPLTYLPGTFLPYKLPLMLGIDVRWATVLAHGICLSAMLWFARQTRGKKWLDAPGFIVWAVVFISADQTFFDATNTAPWGWAALVWLVATLSVQSKHIGIAFGLAICTTPLALCLLPLTLACFFRSPFSRDQRLFQVAAAIAIAVVGILPFWLWSPQAFTTGLVHWFNDLDGWSADKWQQGSWWARYPGFAGLFWTNGWQGTLRLFQWAGIIALAVGWHRRWPSSALVPFAAALSFLWFIAFNHMLWPYFFHPAILLLALGWSGDLRASNYYRNPAVPGSPASDDNPRGTPLGP